jgi:hypothetical protein
MQRKTVEIWFESRNAFVSVDFTVHFHSIDLRGQLYVAANEVLMIVAATVSSCRYRAKYDETLTLVFAIGATGDAHFHVPFVILRNE